MLAAHTVILIGGPTASGKTGLSVSLAQNINGAIINADSMQVYKELSILTARPTDDEMKDIDHHMFGHVPITQHYSVANWRKQALETINTLHKDGKIPILVGGTGLYFKALIEGLSPIPEISLKTREKIGHLYDEIGAEAFHDKLKEIDPEIAKRLPPTDRQRCIRALEVYEDTGKTLSHWQDMPRVNAPEHLNFKALILTPERQTLYDKINHRFDIMMEQGALDEVKALHDLNPDPLLPSLKAVGIPPLRAYLDGETSLEEAIDTCKTQSRRYAKRQFTWFNNQLPEQKTDRLTVHHIAVPSDIQAALSLILA